jgi:formylglycine-generating enzyme required for sulfatase activity
MVKPQNDAANMGQPTTCCSPARDQGGATAVGKVQPEKSAADFDVVRIGEGRSLIGTAATQIPDDGESPLRKSRHKAFDIARCAVSNTDFAAFVSATGYITEAERFGWSFVFYSDVPKASGPTQRYPGADWWRRVDGANWRDIDGPGTQATRWHGDHPVVQVSWHDAQAYAAWVGGRLPKEVEWEAAARGNLGDVRFPWGNAEPDDQDHTPCNIWQGDFPRVNTGRDGFVHTAPVISYEPNSVGLFNMVGNVWEWTNDLFGIKSMKKHIRQRLDGMRGYRLSKGGSYLCHKSYCYRYRIAARSGSSPDSGTPHHGFRVVWDV